MLVYDPLHLHSIIAISKVFTKKLAGVKVSIAPPTCCLVICLSCNKMYFKEKTSAGQNAHFFTNCGTVSHTEFCDFDDMMSSEAHGIQRTMVPYLVYEQMKRY